MFTGLSEKRKDGLRCRVNRLMRLTRKKHVSSKALGDRIVSQGGDKPGLSRAGRPLQQADRPASDGSFECLFLIAVQLIERK